MLIKNLIFVFLINYTLIPNFKIIDFYTINGESIMAIQTYLFKREQREPNL